MISPQILRLLQAFRFHISISLVCCAPCSRLSLWFMHRSCQRMSEPCSKVSNYYAPTIIALPIEPLLASLRYTSIAHIAMWPHHPLHVRLRPQNPPNTHYVAPAAYLQPTLYHVAVGFLQTAAA
uniref:Putative secreted protein n=1 Tax=Anopheles marajoara TaxID=58244 RepID=A0A2M4C7C9_9DIPT